MASASSTLPAPEVDPKDSNVAVEKANPANVNSSNTTVMEHTELTNTVEKASSPNESDQNKEISKDAGTNQTNRLPLETISSRNTEHNAPSDEHVRTAQQVSAETDACPPADPHRDHPTSRSEIYPNSSYVSSAIQENEQEARPKDQGYSYELTGTNSQGQHPGSYYKNEPQESSTTNSSPYSQPTGEYRNDTNYQSYPYNTEGYNQSSVEQAPPPTQQPTESSNLQVASQHDPPQEARPNDEPGSSAQPRRSEWDGYEGEQSGYSSRGYQQDSYGDYSNQYNNYSQERPSYNHPKDNYDYKDQQYYDQSSSYQGSYVGGSNYQHSNQQPGDSRDGRNDGWGRERFSEPVYNQEQHGRYADYNQDQRSYQQPYNTSNPSSSYQTPRYSNYSQGRTMPATGSRGGYPPDRGSGYYQDNPYSSDYSDHSTGYPQDSSEPQDYPVNYDGQYSQDRPPVRHTEQDPRRMNDPRVLNSNYDGQSTRHYTSSANYSGGGSTFLQKRAAMLKRAEGTRHFQRGKSSKGPQIIQPHRVSDADPIKDKKIDKVKNVEASFPKRTLEKFKIPKRKSATISSPVKTPTPIPALDLPERVQEVTKQEVNRLPTPTVEEPTTSSKTKKKSQAKSSTAATAGKSVDSAVKVPVKVASTKSNTFPTVLSSLDSSTLLALAATIQKTLDQAKAGEKMGTSGTAVPIVGASKKPVVNTLPISIAKNVPTPVVATPLVAAPAVTDRLVSTPAVAIPLVATPAVLTSVVATPIVSTPVVATPILATHHVPTPPVATLPVASPNVPTSVLPASTAVSSNSVHLPKKLEKVTSTSVPSVQPKTEKHRSTGMVLATTISPPSTATKSSTQPSKPPLSAPLGKLALSQAVQSLLFSTAIGKDKPVAPASTDSNISLSSLVAKLCNSVLPLATTSGTISSSKLETSTSTNIVTTAVKTNVASQQLPIVADVKTVEAPSLLSQQQKTTDVEHIANVVTGGSEDSRAVKRIRPVDENNYVDNIKKQKLDEDKAEVNGTANAQEPPVSSMDFDTGSNTTGTHTSGSMTVTPFCIKLDKLETQPSVKKIAASHTSGPQSSLLLPESQVQPSFQTSVSSDVNVTKLSTFKSSGTHIGLLASNEKVTTARKRSTSRSKKKQGASQLSAKVASTTVCSFCHKKDSELNLGFLYGPYKSDVRQDTKPSTDSTVADTNKNSQKSEAQSGIWVHEDCMVWAPGVCLVGGQLIGLTEAVVDAEKMTCLQCKESGATLFCSTHNCKKCYHYHCARDTGCSFKVDQFLISCPKHTASKESKSNP